MFDRFKSTTTLMALVLGISAVSAGTGAIVAQSSEPTDQPTTTEPTDENGVWVDADGSERPIIDPEPTWNYLGHESGVWVDSDGSPVGYSRQEDTPIRPLDAPVSMLDNRCTVDHDIIRDVAGMTGCDEITMSDGWVVHFDRPDDDDWSGWTLHAYEDRPLSPRAAVRGENLSGRVDERPCQGTHSVLIHPGHNGRARRVWITPTDDVCGR